ncbi:hypothetical protein PR048_003326 [Dryococelus australis]|uniref:Uncharacterized protein n=1 Tax=Dryococelus australis TaxID=614101 RepID=A0ABQ9IN96_9NEOP|nr:hypothetical protein PR048_003326 [Dryococelus australis]
MQLVTLVCHLERSSLCHLADELPCTLGMLMLFLAVLEELLQVPKHVEMAQSSASESQDLHQMREEYTQRLSALERQFQQAIREKEVLRKQLDHARQEAASRLSAEELQSLCAEKDDLIKQLTMEGEKLSKRELNYCNRIKELKAKETELENTVKNQKAQLRSLSQEVERLKLSLTAKEDMERKHIEAVDKLTAASKRQEKELGQARAQSDDSRTKVAQLAESLEVVHRWGYL